MICIVCDLIPLHLAEPELALTYLRQEHYASPANSPEGSPLLYESHAGLSPVFLQIAGLDPLRDEGILYERVLREAGVQTNIIVYVASNALATKAFHMASIFPSAAWKFPRSLRRTSRLASNGFWREPILLDSKLKLRLCSVEQRRRSATN